MKKGNSSSKMVLIGTFAFTILLFSTSLVSAGWNVVSPPEISSDWTLNGVHFTSKDEGWALGSDLYNKKGVLLHYSGGTWTSVPPPTVSLNWELFGVHFTTEDEGWAVGRDNTNKEGVLLHYHNGSWTSVLTPTYSGSSWHLNSVHFTSANEGWAVGEDNSAPQFLLGVLLHYSNNSWTAISPPFIGGSSWTLYDVHLTSSAEGWAVGGRSALQGGRGVLLHYKNNSWVPATPPNAGTNWDLQGVQFTSANEGWAAGNDYQYPIDTGLLFHYSSGTWTPLRRSHLSLSWYLYDAHFVSSTVGWAVGIDVPTSSTQKGLLIRYSGGIWSFVTPPQVSSVWGLTGVHFTSSDEGWAVGRDETNKKGVLLKYITLPEINVTPISHDFGTVSIGKALTKTITVKNDGDLNLILESIEDPAVPFHRSGGTCTNGKVLIPGGTCSIVAQFIPGEDGYFTSSIVINSNDPDEPSAAMSLAGRSGPADLIGELESLIQTCIPYRGSTRCKLGGMVTVQNIGYSTSRSSSIKFYLSDDENFDAGDTYFKKSALGGLRISASKNIRLSYTFPLGVSASEKYVIAVIDPDNRVVELNDDNNVAVSDAKIP